MICKPFAARTAARTAVRVDAANANNALPLRARAVVNFRVQALEIVMNVQARLVRVMADAQFWITPMGVATDAPLAPLTPKPMSAVEGITAEMCPGTPVTPVVSASVSNAHGLNEMIPAKSLCDAHDFQYRLGARLRRVTGS